MNILWHEFTNCGVRHIQDRVTKEVTPDQTEFAGNLHPIAHPQLLETKSEEPCCSELHQLYRSLLGAVAYLTHTRVDVQVFICAFQKL